MTLHNYAKSFERRSDTEILNVMNKTHTLTNTEKAMYATEWGLSFDESSDDSSSFGENTPGSFLFGIIGVTLICGHFMGISILAWLINLIIFLGKALICGGTAVGTAKAGHKLIIKINGKEIKK